jgi:hypothetical protein
VQIYVISGQVAHVIERQPLGREVRGLNPSRDTMALLLGRHYEFSQSMIIKGNLLSSLLSAIHVQLRVLQFLLLF